MALYNQNWMCSKIGYSTTTHVISFRDEQQSCLPHAPEESVASMTNVMIDGMMLLAPF
jgi:hypothetical protein